MEKSNKVYRELGVHKVINGVGTRTQVSGSKLREGVIDAMDQASEQHVYMAELQAAASKRISEATGADAGIVTPGAAAALTIGSAACIAGNDFGIMADLPNTNGVSSEIVMPKAHRIKYDSGFRASGATLVDVGIVSHHPVNGGVDKVEPWEFSAAITDETVAIGYVERPHNILDLEKVIKIAHDHNLPIIVDAASEVPPYNNLTRFIDMGVDLVAYSGGKGLGGPQPTGILAGRKDLIQAAALIQVPDGYNNYIWSPPEVIISRDTLPKGTPPTSMGRPFKVGPEEIVGLLTALDEFCKEDHEAVLTEWVARAEKISNILKESPYLDVRLSDGKDKASGVPKVIACVDKDAPRSAVEIIAALRQENPRVWVGERRVSNEEISVSPVELTDEEAVYLSERLLAQF